LAAFTALLLRALGQGRHPSEEKGGVITNLQYVSRRAISVTAHSPEFAELL